MKKPIIFSFAIFLSTFSFSQDTAFFDHGWLKMMDEGKDYQSIIDRSHEAYADTAFQKKAYNYHHFARWDNYWKNRVYSTPDEAAESKFGLFYHHSNSVAASIGQPACSNHPDSDWESWGFDTHPDWRDAGGPINWGGMGVMFAVTADTSDPNLQTLYAGSPLGGVWNLPIRGTAGLM